MNQGIHTLDLLLWFLGEPVRVFASSRTLAHERIDVEDTLAAVIEFASGALATVHATTAAYPGLTARLEVRGSRGSAVIEHDTLSYLHLAVGTAVGDMGLHGAGNQLCEFTNHTRNTEATLNATSRAPDLAGPAFAYRVSAADPHIHR